MPQSMITSSSIERIIVMFEPISSTPPMGRTEKYLFFNYIASCACFSRDVVNISLILADKISEATSVSSPTVKSAY